jgi:dihydrofolate synthase/folylpolyglutamate synthase
VLIFATSVDKDVRGMLRCLVPEFDTVIVTRFQNNPRAMGHEDLQRLIQSTSNHRVHAVADPVSAWQVARRLAGPRGMICATGSIFIAAEIREIAFEELPQLATQAAGRRPDHAQTAPCSRSPVANDASC